MNRGIPLAAASPAGIAVAEGLKALCGATGNDAYKNVKYCIPNGKLACSMPEHPSLRENANHKIKYVDHIGYIPQNSTIYTSYNNVDFNTVTVKNLKDLLDKNNEIFKTNEEKKIPEYEICTIHVKREMIYNMYDYKEGERGNHMLKQLYDEAFKFYPKEKDYVIVKIMIKIKDNPSYMKLPRIKCIIHK